LKPTIYISICCIQSGRFIPLKYRYVPCAKMSNLFLLSFSCLISIICVVLFCFIIPPMHYQSTTPLYFLTLSTAFLAASAARSVSLYSSLASTALSIPASRTSPTAPNTCLPPSTTSSSSANC